MESEAAITHSSTVKVGDKVKLITGREGHHNFEKGSIVTVTHLYGDGDIEAENAEISQYLNPSDYELVVQEHAEVSALPEPSGEAIKPGIRIGDKVRVLTDGEEYEGQEDETHVGWHEFQAGEILEVIEYIGDEDGNVGEIKAKRPGAADYDYNYLHGDDYELVVEEPASAESGELPELLSPKQVVLLMFGIKELVDNHDLRC